MGRRPNSTGNRRPEGCPWIAVLGWMLLAAVSCTGPFEKSRFLEGSSGVQQELVVVSFIEAVLRFALVKLENGDFAGARETLTEIRQREDSQEVEPEVTFALGVLKLLDMETMERMRGCRHYFQAFVDEHPGGPYRENAERIVQVLSSHIRREQKERKRIKDLIRQVSDQEQVIHTLRYKIEKLEEINRETEKKRHLLRGE